MRILAAGTSIRRRGHALPRQEALLRRVQVSEVQAQVDVGQQLGQHGTGMHQVPHQRLPTQTGAWTMTSCPRLFVDGISDWSVATVLLVTCNKSTKSVSMSLPVFFIFS